MQAFLLACYICLQISPFLDIQPDSALRRDAFCTQCLIDVFSPHEFNQFEARLALVKREFPTAAILDANPSLRQLLKDRLDRKLLRVTTSEDPYKLISEGLEKLNAQYLQKILEEYETKSRIEHFDVQKRLESFKHELQAILGTHNFSNRLFGIFPQTEQDILGLLLAPKLFRSYKQNIAITDEILNASPSLKQLLKDRLDQGLSRVSASEDPYNLLAEGIEKFNKQYLQKILEEYQIKSNFEYFSVQKRLDSFEQELKAILSAQKINGRLLERFQRTKQDVLLDILQPKLFHSYKQNIDDKRNLQTLEELLDQKINSFKEKILRGSGKLIDIINRLEDPIEKTSFIANEFSETLKNGVRLMSGDSLISKNAKYRATMHTSGLLVVTNKNGNIIYKIGNQSNREASHHLLMQADGNLVIYNDLTLDPTWSSGSWVGYPNGESFHLVLGDDGSLKIYNGAKQIVWTSQQRYRNYDL